jgi:putative Mn2+ efflux pump MntP
MNIFSLIALAVGLSMDAFAVAICKGLSIQQINLKKMAVVGAYFGIFQGVMPLIGYCLGRSFSHIIESYDHWVAFALLAFIGGKMIKESFAKDGAEGDASLRPAAMLILAIATSIDALAVGITLAFLHVNILQAVLLIGCTTFLLSAAGVKIGNIFGCKYKSKAELLGGAILILIGINLLLEHLGILG